MKINKLILPVLVALLPITDAVAQENTFPSTYQIGSFNLTVLPEMQNKGNKSILIGATDEMLEKYLPDGTYPTAINAFLLETPDKTILVDAGLGRNLSAHLETCKIKPEDIDIILLTHMHGDHIGGLLTDGKKSFPSATLYVSQPEYDHWVKDTKAGAVLDAYKDKLHLFVPNEVGTAGKELLPGVQGIAIYGHTPGHTGYLVQSDGEQLLIWGDTAHAMDIQMPCPQVAVTYDVDPVQATASRQRILKYVADNKIRVAGMHIVYPGIGDIGKDNNNGYIFSLLCTCEGMFR